MDYRKYLLPACCLLMAHTLTAQEGDTKQKMLDVVQVKDSSAHDFGNLRRVDDMKVTVGKKTEVIQVDQLTVNKSTNNTRQLYAKVAGLNIFENDGSGLQLSIGGRGLDPNRTSNFNVRQNGYDISADALGYPESYYTPPADALKSIEIIKGAASLQFGTQFGGLLNFKMRSPGGEKPLGILSKQTVGSWGFFSSFNSIYGTKGKLSYYAYAHYKRGDGWRPNSGYHSLNAYAAVDYALNDRHNLTLAYTHLNYLAQQPGGLDDNMFGKDPRQSNRPRNWFAVSWNLLNLKWAYQVSANTRWETQLTGLLAQRDAIGFRPNRPSQPDNGGKRDLLRGEFRNLSLESRLLQHYQFMGQRQTLLAGIRLYKGDNSSRQGYVNNGSDADFTFDPRAEMLSDYIFPNLNIAAFAEHIFRLSDRWSITPGFRIEYIRTQSEGTYFNRVYDLRDSILSEQQMGEQRNLQRQFLIAGIGSSYTLSHALEAYGNISQNYRSVTFGDLQLVNPSFEIDPAIQDEKGWSADLGLRGNIGTGFRFDVSGFYLYYGNKIGEYFMAKSNGQVIRKRGNIGVARIYGLESYLELDVLQLLLRQKKAISLLLYSNLAITNAHMTESPVPNVKGNRVEYVPVLNWKTGLQAGYRNLRLSLQLSRLSEQFTDATNARDGGYSGVNGILPAYTLMDLSVAWSWKWLLAEASLNNLTNAVYTTRRATGYPGPGIIPGEGRAFFFTLGLRL